MSKMLDSMSEELGNVQFKLSAAREKAATANALVTALEREERALQSAIDILAGNEPKPAPEPTLDRETIIRALGTLAPSVAAQHALSAEASEQGGAGPLGLKPKAEIRFDLPEGWTRGALNGEEILLEPGMVVGKNSFGEEVIVPRGTTFAPMEEPVKPASIAPLLPPIADEEGFDSIESQLDGV